MADITLYQFAGSHFNEKARWALDLKAVPHERISLIPGPHMLRVKRLTGRTEVPVLVDRGQVIPGSADILAHLEERFPEPQIEPAVPEEREHARAVVREFDAEVGPAVRLAMFYDVLSAEYVIRTFCAEKSQLVKTTYRASFPMVKRAMESSMGINAESAARARERTRQALDFVAKQSNDKGYLVGDRFSVADLTAAALLMPAIDVSDLGGPARARTEAENAWRDRWANHPGGAWVREIYRRHRRP